MGLKHWKVPCDLNASPQLVQRCLRSDFSPTNERVSVSFKNPGIQPQTGPEARLLWAWWEVTFRLNSSDLGETQRSARCLLPSARHDSGFVYFCFVTGVLSCLILKMFCFLPIHSFPSTCDGVSLVRLVHRCLKLMFFLPFVNICSSAETTIISKEVKQFILLPLVGKKVNSTFVWIYLFKHVTTNYNIQWNTMWGIL